MTEITFSVCIPVLNGAATIGETLEALRRQTLAPLEVIVADGGSTDGTRDVVARYPEATLLTNPQRHAAGGRNVAIAAARGSWCGFTDDDCVPEPGWLAAVAERVRRSPGTIGVGGRVVPLPPRSLIESVCASAFLDGVMQYDDRPAVVASAGLRRAPITANAAYLRDALASVDAFDPRFSNYAEDIDLFLRLRRADLGVVWYEPAAEVAAQFPSTVRAMVQKWRQYGMASSWLQRYHFGRVHVDTFLYARLGRSLRASVTATGQARERARIESLQIVSHLLGKWEGSVRRGVINL